MKTINYLFVIALTITLFACKTEVKKETETTTENTEELAVVEEKSLYDNLGGAEGISAIVDDIVDEHLKNEAIKQYFIPLKEDAEHFEMFKTHVKNFFGAGTGGSEEYKGRDMSGAHKGMNLSEADFLHALDDILLVLDKHNIDRNSRNEVLAILFSMKWAVVKQ